MAARSIVTPKLAKKIRLLWRTPSFPGSFSGLSNFALALKGKNIQLTKHEVFDIMKTDQDFILETKKKRKRFQRRKLMVHGFGNIWQADIGDMIPFRGYKSFLCCVDLFSRNIYCKKLKSKTATAVKNKFQQIFNEVGFAPEKLETDRGSEFIGNRLFFKERNVFFKTKTGANKAAFAEHAIQVKNYLLLRSIIAGQIVLRGVSLGIPSRTAPLAHAHVYVSDNRTSLEKNGASSFPAFKGNKIFGPFGLWQTSSA